jgi:predicted MPP superfamily phosphohydrolase
MFGTVLLTFYTFILVYLLWRAASVPLIARTLPRWALILIGLFLWILFYLGRFFGHGGEGKLAVVVEYLGMNGLGVVFLAFVIMLTADLVTGFGLLMPRRAPSIRGGALILSALLAVFALWQGHRAPAVVRYEVPLKGLPAELDGTVLVALSDMHLGKILGSRWLEARVRQIRALNPDIIALVGDIFEGHGGPPESSLAALRRLSPPLGVWFVSGNHEGHGDGRANGEILDLAGFHRLDDLWVEVRPGLVLAGVSDLTARRRRNQGGDPVGTALSGHPPGGTVLLSHSPLQADSAARAGAGLMISGHTHGGQIGPFNYLVQRRYPLLAGLYEVKGMPVIVTRGAGTWGPRMRLFRRSEILMITLRNAPDQGT